MSEKSPTEKLRAMLDERGIEHFDHENGEPLRKIEKAGEDPATSWQIDGVSYCAVPDRHGTFDVWIDHATPEQAVAATVGDGEGSRDEWRSVALGLLESLEEADLETAKQWIAKNTVLRQEIAYGRAEAATVGAGTCHFKVVIDQDPSRRGRGNICECDKCGYRCARGFIEDERFKHCPNCDKRIEVGE